jgi:hypothetical protein
MSPTFIEADDQYTAHANKDTTMPAVDASLYQAYYSKP